MINETTKEAVKANKLAELKQFTATQNNIVLTAELIAHMAIKDVLWIAYKQAVKDSIEEGNYKFDDRGGNDPFVLTFNDKFYSDNTYRMQGVGLYGKDEYNGSDADKHNNDMNKRTRDKGMVHAENTMCIIDTKIRELERNLVKSIEHITSIDIDMLYGEKREKLIQLTLQLMVPCAAKMNKADRTKIEKSVYSNFLNK